MTRTEIRDILAKALSEWRDAGGPVEAVVDAVENLVWVVETGEAYSDPNQEKYRG